MIQRLKRRRILFFSEEKNQKTFTFMRLAEVSGTWPEDDVHAAAWVMWEGGEQLRRVRRRREAIWCNSGRNDTGVVCGLAFYDALIHRFYRFAPEVWRPSGRMRIVVSQVVGTLATAAAVEMEVLVHGRPLLVAGWLWAAGPLPLTLQNLQWMRIHPAVGASHALGWLARLLIATEIAARFL